MKKSAPFIVFATVFLLLAFNFCIHAARSQTLLQGTAVDETEAPTLNQITGATAGNTIDNKNNAQSWTWNTQTTQTALSVSSSSATSGIEFSAANTTSGNSGYAGYFQNTATGSTGYAIYAAGPVKVTGAETIGGALSATATVSFTGVTTGAMLCLTAAGALGHCSGSASCLTTCTCTCVAN